ncbi:maleylpyruvate isomerase N-terminal domain-containing protein, partial [Helicobacter bizzozeronii]|uniref:maleylpyruvate isomerase N-terminal domain-containing protein n=1 Tax=Helicobacter bizzozeronii TaxID=56877 RepID=UPI0025579011
MGDEPIVDVLEHIWSSTLLATEGLDEGDWVRPSELPGWTLKDCMSHVATIEAGLMGEAPDPVPVDHLDHVVTPFQEMMEVGVEAWRPLSGAEVRARFADITPRRVAQLRAMSDEEMSAPSWSPIGEVPYRRFL